MGGTGQPTIVTDPAAVAAVIEMLTSGQSERKIRELLASTCPGADPQAVLVEAVEHFERASRCDKAVVQGWALEAYREIYRLAIATVDLPSAIRAVKELEKLATDVQCYGEEEGEDDEAADEPQALAPAEGKRAKPRRAAKKRKPKDNPRSNNSRGKGPSPPGEV